MRAAVWTEDDIPSQVGRVAVVTGTGGLGYQSALGLARAGAEVIVAGRNPQKGDVAVGDIRARVPHAKVSFELLDLADLKSIAAFGARTRARRQSLDLLVNNAGVMIPPRRLATADGFELQFGTNFLGPFALTSELLTLLRAGKNPRVVSVSALAAHGGEMHFENLQAESSYKPWAAYCQSKLADLLFAFELQRRSDLAGWGLTSVAAHPGIARTDLVPNGTGRYSLLSIAMRVVGPILFQTAAQGALPILFAATSLSAKAGGYYGPKGRSERRGDPGPARTPHQAEDVDVAQRLWSLSERLIGASFGHGT